MAGSVPGGSKIIQSIIFMKYLLFLIFSLCALVVSADTWIDPKTGIIWDFTVEEGQVSLGGGSKNSCAVPPSTTGDLVIPSMLEGYPVTRIGGYAFYCCRELTSVTIPFGVTSIGEWAFYGCGELKSVMIPISVTSIGEWAFLGCCGLTSVTIPSGLTSIGQGVFAACRNLTSVSLPLGVTSIGEWAFSGCDRLMSIEIPSSVAHISGRAFSGCDKLASFVVASDNPIYCSFNGLLCTRRGSVLIAGINGDVIIPSCVTSIGDNAFALRSGLKSVVIPPCVTNLGDRAFFGCSSLTSVTIPPSVTSVGKRAFIGCSNLSVVYGEDGDLVRVSSLTGIPLSKFQERTMDNEGQTPLNMSGGGRVGLDCHSKLP